MIKIIYLVQRKQRMSPAAFEKYWLKTHAPIAAKIPGLLKYSISVCLDPSDPIPEGFDGVAEMWFKNRNMYLEALQSEAWDAVREDGENFVAYAETIITREHIILPNTDESE